jgi:hypothetical protein
MATRFQLPSQWPQFFGWLVQTLITIQGFKFGCKCKTKKPKKKLGLLKCGD